jgi:hypothetical protein
MIQDFYHPKNHAMARKPWMSAITTVSRARFTCHENGILPFPFIIMEPSAAVPMRQRNRILPATMITGNVIYADNAMYKSSRSSLIKVSRREGDYGSFVIVVSGDDVKETTLHFPLTHPQLPAPQSIGPSQLIVHIRLHTPLFALLVQLVG